MSLLGHLTNSPEYLAQGLWHARKAFDSSATRLDRDNWKLTSDQKLPFKCGEDLKSKESIQEVIQE